MKPLDEIKKYLKQAQEPPKASLVCLNKDCRCRIRKKENERLKRKEMTND